MKIRRLSIYPGIKLHVASTFNNELFIDRIPNGTVYKAKISHVEFD